VKVDASIALMGLEINKREFCKNRNNFWIEHVKNISKVFKAFFV